MFDRFVSGTRPSWKRRAVLIVSLGAHGVLAVGLVVASLFHVAEIAPPALAIVFIATPEPPPPESPPRPRAHKPLAAGHASKPAAQKLAAATVPAEVTPPAIAPDRIALEPQPTREEGGGQGPPSDGKGGGGEGPPDDSSSRAPGIGSSGQRARNIGPHLLDAQKIAGAEPHLPEFVRTARRGLGDSAFMARLCVDQSGRVARVDVLQGIAGADDAIVSALRGWRYRPQPIPVCFVSRFVFDVQ